MAQVIWTIKAVEQVEQIGSFIQKDSPFQSRRVVQSVGAKDRTLRFLAVLIRETCATCALGIGISG